MGITFVTNDQLYKLAIEPVSGAASSVLIGTADIQDLHVHHKGTAQSFLSILDNLAKRKVAFRLLNAKKPGPNLMKYGWECIVKAANELSFVKIQLFDI